MSVVAVASLAVRCSPASAIMVEVRLVFLSGMVAVTGDIVLVLGLNVVPGSVLNRVVVA